MVHEENKLGSRPTLEQMLLWYDFVIWHGNWSLCYVKAHSNILCPQCGHDEYVLQLGYHPCIVMKWPFLPQCCVLSRSVKTKRDTYDLVLRLCQLQSQFHGPNTFFGNSTRRWITLFSLRRACNWQCSGIRNKMNCQATCHRFAKVTCSAIATLSTTAQAVTLLIFICAITKQWAAKIIASTALSRWMLSA